MSSETTSALTFDLQQDLLDKLKQLQRQSGARSISEVIRYAVSVFDSSELGKNSSSHRQISVRLSNELRQRLIKLSKQKKVSVGGILRAALDSLPAKLSDVHPELIMPKKKATKKKAAKKVVVKAPAEKAVKKSVAKKPAKKAVKKAVKKAAPKKKAAKKAVKKAAPKKKAAKKAVKKAAPKK
ncbi:MAG: ribbon-helix-helix protein, CopG family, partial [Opitutales bacterium]|nr:ribbon-helix-helix protein, CopG family [Opitutales bacterium]MDP4777739.1 ribbon-helix-helix protein, CopG family [Opitutales bacterium]MDP5079767.1 ribbon-helix-helix protein, CopG family [Opitutales bacterium]